MTTHNSEHGEHRTIEQQLDKVLATLEAHAQNPEPHDHNDHEVLEAELKQLLSTFDEHVQHSAKVDSEADATADADHEVIEQKLHQVIEAFNTHVAEFNPKDDEEEHAQLKALLEQLTNKFEAHVKHDS